MGSKIGASGYRFIGAFDNGRRRYFVRIPLPGQKGRFARKEFSCQAGALPRLLAKARKWRDSKYLELYGHKVPTRTIHKRQGNNRATAIPGVRRQTKTVEQFKNGRTYSYTMTMFIAEVWLGSGVDGKRANRSRSKVFSIAKYGESGARKLAIAWRTEMERRLLHDGPDGFEKWWNEAKLKRPPRPSHVKE